MSAEKGLPLRWSATKNIVWRKELPGPGTSSPITLGNRVYVTCYSGYGLDKQAPGNVRNLKRHLLCLDPASGRIQWRAETPIGTDSEHGYDGFLAMHGYATSTPVADESGVYVYYGTVGVAAYDHQGKPRWRKKLGNGVHGFGSSSSPLLYGDLLIVHADIEARALIAMDKRTGEETWRVDTGSSDSWSTPLLLNAGGRTELVFHHSQGDPNGLLASVDPRTGKPLWRCRVLKDYLCPSPIGHDGVIYVLAYRRGAAVRAGGTGDVTTTHVKWTINKGTEVCTPIYHNGHLYWVHQESGIAHCVNAATGNIVYQQRLQPRPGRMYASGVLADGRIYYVSRENGTYAVAARPDFELLAHNVIETDDSVFNATPAIHQGRLLIRSRKFLYCIGE